MKILLIYPEIPATYWSYKYILPFVGKKAAFPPLSLLTVAALLPREFAIRLVDMNVSPLLDSDIREADLVFVSAMIVQKESLTRVIERCKTLHTPVVAGGPYPTALHKEIEGADHFILGEAEETLQEFLEDLKKGNAQRVYQSKTKPNLAKVPVPRFDLINPADYASMALQYSRGCPFNCEFCDIIELYGRVPRTKGSAQFLAELDALYATGYRGSLFIVDDNFIGNKKQVKSLLKSLVEWQRAKGNPFIFFTEASINMAEDSQLMELMAQAGFSMVFIGIETPDAESLKHTHKLQNTKTNLLQAIRKIQKMGMEVIGGFIIGFDTDKADIFQLQLDFIQTAGIPTAMVGLLTATPNTQLYRRLAREGRLLRQSTGNNTHDIRLNFQPTMGMDTVIEGYKGLIKKLYHPKYYFRRCITLLKNLKTLPNSLGDVSKMRFLMGLKAVLSSVGKQLFSSYGPRYLGFLFRALLLRPLLFPKAVRLAILEHHFLKITKEVLAADKVRFHIDRVSQKLRIKLQGIRQMNYKAALEELATLFTMNMHKIQKMYRRVHKDFNGPIEDSLRAWAILYRKYLEKIFHTILQSGGKISLKSMKGQFHEFIKQKPQVLENLNRIYGRLNERLKSYIVHPLHYWEELLGKEFQTS